MKEVTYILVAALNPGKERFECTGDELAYSSGILSFSSDELAYSDSDGILRFDFSSIGYRKDIHDIYTAVFAERKAHVLEYRLKKAIDKKVEEALS